MSTTLMIAAAAFAAGFALGFMRPANYCHLSTAQRYGFGNRASSGVINGAVFAGVTGVIASFAFGAGL